MATPAWLAATSGQRAQAGQINQFLGSHAANVLYNGVQLGASTAGSGSTNTNGLYIAQLFVPGSTQSPGRFNLTLSVTGTPAPLTISIQSGTGSAPNGTPIVSVQVPHEALTGTLTSFSVPLPCTLTASVDYWIVLNAVGDVSDYYSVGHSTSTSGVSTSTNGTSWTGQTYGLTYMRFDQTPTGALVHTYEDSGARWTSWGFNANGTPSSVLEYTVGQGTNQYLFSSRSLTYTNSKLVSVA